LLRAAYHSSSYDYNLTAQLVTDGIITTRMTQYLLVITSNGTVPKNEREWLLDHNSVTVQQIEGNNIWIKLELMVNDDMPEITSLKLDGNVTIDDKKPGGWQFKCSGSNDGEKWQDLGSFK
jgi:hypothetical protein